MHELSLAVNIIEIAVEEARRSDAAIVHEVIVEAGALSGVDAEILKGALLFASKNTSLESAIFSIQVTPGKGICANCGNEFEMQDIYARCNICGGAAEKLTEGTEFRIVALKVD